MFAMDRNQLQKFKWLMFISSIITLFSLPLLLWNYGPSKTFQSCKQYYQATTELSVQRTVPPPGQIVPQGENVSFVAVPGTKTLLVSAYREHRKGKKEVRLISVVLRSEKIAYRCLLLCQGKLRTTTGVREIHRDHFGFAYGTADIMCPLPRGCETPSLIAVTSAASNSEDPIEFLKVKNQKAQSESFPYNFTTCISTLYDFTNVLQLVQSLEMLQLLGVNRVVIYKSSSSSPETQSILDYYTHKGLVEVVPWSMSRFLKVSRFSKTERGPGDLHYFGQIPALNDCIYRYMYRSRYMLLHDIDELILPQSVNSLTELLPLLEKKYGADKCYQFENDRFPNNVMLPPPSSQTLPPQGCCPGWKNVSGVNILAHLYREPFASPTRSNFKIIVNPRAVFSVSVHGVLSSKNGCSWVHRNISRLHHTRSQSKPELKPDKLIYDGRLLSYSARLIPNVNTVFRESGLLPEDSTQ